MPRRSSLTRALVGAIPLAMLVAACGDDTPTPVAQEEAVPADPAASVRFVEPVAGEHVAGGLHVVMEAEGITIEPAGEVHEGAGHFHVIADHGCANPGEAITKDADHVHFGKAQTEATIYLGPGEHELCLQVGDGVHSALDLTDSVTVDVGVEDQAEWCAVIGETDELFVAGDDTTQDFAVRQASFSGITRLIAQLTDGIDVVPEADREAVTENLEYALAIASAVAGAVDQAAADVAVSALFPADAQPPDAAGGEWIRTNCQVDIND